MADSRSPAHSELSPRVAQDDRQEVEGGAEGLRPLSVPEADEQGVVDSLRQMQVDSSEVGSGNAGTEESDMELGETSGGAALADRADSPTPTEQAGGMGYQWAEEVANSELLSRRSKADDEDDATSLLSDKESESSRGRERCRGLGQGTSPTAVRAKTL